MRISHIELYASSSLELNENEWMNVILFDSEILLRFSLNSNYGQIYSTIRIK